MLILASRSPRRAELLAAAGIAFTIRAADIDETPHAGEDPISYVKRMAQEKAAAVPRAANETVLAADTTVVCDGEIMGKPVNDADAARMLTQLSGKRHDVITGVSLESNKGAHLEAAVTGVWFAPLSQAEIDWYVASGEPRDKAGAYGIQGLASRFIQRIDGSYSNVVGLPVALVHQLLTRAGSI